MVFATVNYSILSVNFPSPTAERITSCGHRGQFASLRRPGTSAIHGPEVWIYCVCVCLVRFWPMFVYFAKIIYRVMEEVLGWKDEAADLVVEINLLLQKDTHIHTHTHTWTSIRKAS